MCFNPKLKQTKTGVQQLNTKNTFFGSVLQKLAWDSLKLYIMFVWCLTTICVENKEGERMAYKLKEEKIPKKNSFHFHTEKETGTKILLN